MSTYNIIRKDYKPVQKNTEASPNIGIAAATIEGSILLSRKDILEASLSFMNDEKLDALLLMFLYFENNDTKPNRQIVVFTPDHRLRGQLCDFMTSEQELMMAENKFQLTNELAEISKFYDHSMKWSRKKLLPLVNNFI